jgi:hypothetical protein
MAKRKEQRRIGLIGVVLMAIAGLFAGLFLGAYYSEPIMAGIVDSQNNVIAQQSTSINELRILNQNQKDIILEQDIDIDRFESCYNINVTTYSDMYKLQRCIEQVKK